MFWHYSTLILECCGDLPAIGFFALRHSLVWHGLTHQPVAQTTLSFLGSFLFLFLGINMEVLCRRGPCIGFSWLVLGKVIFVLGFNQ